MTAIMNTAPVLTVPYDMLQRVSAARMLKVTIVQSVSNRFMEETELRLSLVVTTCFTQVVLGAGFQATTAALFAGDQYIKVAA